MLCLYVRVHGRQRDRLAERIIRSLGLVRNGLSILVMLRGLA